jgi:hypothetical protein
MTLHYFLHFSWLCLADKTSYEYLQTHSMQTETLASLLTRRLTITHPKYKRGEATVKVGLIKSRLWYAVIISQLVNNKNKGHRLMLGCAAGPVAMLDKHSLLNELGNLVSSQIICKQSIMKR